MLPGLRASLAQRILRRASEGVVQYQAEIPGLMLLRIDRPNTNVCSVYEPCVALIVQGSKCVNLGSDTLVYGPERYLITAMDLPVTAAITEASPQQPYLAVALKLDWREIAALALDMPKTPAPAAPRPQRAMATGAVSPALLDAFDRLLALLDQPEHLPALAPLVMREIYYWLLAGESGSRLRDIAAVDSQGRQMARVIAGLNARLAQPLRVDTLAREARMSTSSFHQHFKAFTAMSPLQYQKRLRLSEARRLMLFENLDASSAAFRVGYESPSQFSRGYRRQFGAPPSKDIEEMRRAPLATTA
jgi:AraC-like DNA-binding protein